jgi:peptidoglycan hydrolase CwlO-like protein
MNIHGYKLKLKKARNMLENLQKKLDELLRKRKKRLDDKIEINRLFKKIEEVEGGMPNLKNKIKDLRLKRKNAKRK